MVFSAGDGEADLLAKWMIVAAVGTLGACSAVAPPYGRFPLLDAKLGWILMECPNVLMSLWFLLYGSDETCLKSPVNLALLSMFVLHYVNRPMPVPMMLFGALFVSINSYLQCTHLLRSRIYPNSWFGDPRFIIGAATFSAGMFINCQSDGILRRLRRPGETGYKIPQGGMFAYVSGANYFGECVGWIGFAIAGWSLPATAFALYTLSNLAPRARKHHLWYLEKFREGYPAGRKALVPFVW